MPGRKVKHALFVVIPLLCIFFLTEGFVRLLHIPALQDEPYFFGFSGCPAYFLQFREGGITHYRTNPDKDIELTEFRIPKPHEAYRIFVLGGSAVWGEPYGPEGSFARWLRERLRRTYPGKEIEVINCGRRGFGSVRVRHLFDEIIRYEPDLVVVYFGNNEIRDDRFHHNEINIEIRPFLRVTKRVLDHSFIFRMIFYVFFKNKTTSHGAEAVKQVTGQEAFMESAFLPHVEKIERLRRMLDVRYGGDFAGLRASGADSAGRAPFNGDFPVEIEWLSKFQSIFDRNVRHMIRASRERKAGLLMLTRSVNCYYNREYREYFEAHDDAGRLVADACAATDTPLIFTLPVLLRAFGEEIGYNAFTDNVHPTLAGNQAIAREIAARLPILEPVKRAVPEEGVDSKVIARFEKEAADVFPANEGILTLLGWQKLVCIRAVRDESAAIRDIEALAEKALEFNPEFYEADLLLGTLYTMTGKWAEAEKVWLDLKQKALSP